MRCFNNTLMQRYIDSETSVAENKAIETHISECEKCASKLKDYTDFVCFFKESSQDSKKISASEIPAFRRSHSTAKRHKKIKKHLINIAAACTLILIVFSYYKKQQQEEYLIFFEAIDDLDANKAYSEQSGTIFMMDQDGNIIDSFEY